MTKMHITQLDYAKNIDWIISSNADKLPRLSIRRGAPLPTFKISVIPNDTKGERETVYEIKPSSKLRCFFFQFRRFDFKHENYDQHAFFNLLYH